MLLSTGPAGVKMHKQGYTIRFKAPKARMHKALFDPELPFQPKVEKSAKKAYVRKPKHRKGDFDANY